MTEQDPRLPEPPELDPPKDADTEPGAVSETAADTQASDPWEQRYRALQAAYTKTRQELAELRRTLARPEQEEQPSSEADNPYRHLWEQSEWERVKLVYGADVVRAYDAFYRVYETDPTPAGIVAALEAYHEARRQATPAPAASEPAPPPSSPPSAPAAPVDRNVPEAATDYEAQLAEAKARRDLIGWIRARRQQVGL